MIVRRRIDRRSIAESGLDTKDIPEFMSIVSDLRTYDISSIRAAAAFVCQVESHNKIYYLVQFSCGENHNDENDMVLGWYGPNRSSAYKKKVELSGRRYTFSATSDYRKASSDKTSKKYRKVNGFKEALEHVLFNEGGKTTPAKFLASLKGTRLSYEQ